MQNMDESQKLYTKSKKPGTEEHILQGSYYMKCPDCKSIETESKLMIGWQGADK